MRNIILTLLLAFAVSVCMADSAVVSPSAAQLVEEAKLLMSQSRNNEALGKYSEAIALEPKDPMIRFRRAAAYMQTGRSQSAIDDFTAVLRLKPGFEQALMQRGKLYAREGQLKQAEKDLESYFANTHDETIQQTLEDVKKAREAIEEAQNLIKKGMPNVDHVISLLSTAIQTCPQAANLRLLRADAYIKKGESDMAIGDMVRATSLKPDNLDALVKLADIHMSMGEPSESLKHIKQCLHADPENKKCKALFKKTKKLEKTFKRAEDAIAHSDWKLALEVLNDSLLKEAEAVDGPRMKLRVYEMACKAHSEVKDAKQAIAFCTKVLKLDENNIDALAARAEMHIQSEDYEAAQRDYSKAHGIDQNNRKIVEGLHRAQKMAKTAARKDYYKILGVARTASKKEIKKGYRAMATIYHPDKYEGDLNKEEVQKKMMEINEAYEVLSSDDLRPRYDNGEDVFGNDQGQGGNPFGNGFPFGGGGHPFFQQGGGGGGGGFQGGHFTFRFG